jgi:hypothetical protein
MKVYTNGKTDLIKEEKDFLLKSEEYLWKYYCKYLKENMSYYDEKKYLDYNVIPPHVKYKFALILENQRKWDGKIQANAKNYIKKYNAFPKIYDLIPPKNSNNFYQDFKIYSRICRSNFTKIKNKYFKSIESGMSLDHIFSVKSGFEYKVPIWIINCPSNISIIKSSDNSQKLNGNLCTLSELYINFFNYIQEHKDYISHVVDSSIIR